MRTALLTLCLVGPALSAQAAVGTLARAASRVGGGLGVYVVEVPTGRVIWAHAPDRPRLPASNMKILAAATALATLGPDYPFSTTLWACGTLAGGTLRGDLYLAGDGDPFFGAPGEAGPEAFARAVAAAGIRRVTGAVFLVEARLDREYRHPDWAEYGLSVAPPVAALNWGENRVTVAVDRSGRVFVEPPFAPVRVERRRLGRTLVLHWRGPDRLLVQGQPRRGPRRAAAYVPDPPRLAGAALLAALRRSGIRVAGPLRRASAVPAGGRCLARHTVPLRRLLGPCLKQSRNRLAEILFKAAGARLGGGKGSFRLGSEAVRRFLAAIGAPRAGAVIRDGSGLSRRNRLSPRQLVYVLRHFLERPGGEMLLAALPGGGERGTTLAGRFGGPAWKGRLRAKTGYLRGVRALSGCLRVGPERVWVFSCLLEGALPRATARLDQLVAALLRGGAVGAPPPERGRD